MLGRLLAGLLVALRPRGEDPPASCRVDYPPPRVALRPSPAPTARKSAILEASRCQAGDVFFFEIAQHNLDTHNTRTLTLMNTRTQSYPYEHLRRLSRQILEIGEVTTGASLSTRTSSTTECTTPLNPRIFTPT